MRRVLLFLTLFVPILLITLYLSGDLRRLARLPQRKRIKRENEELPLIETEKGYILRSVGNWSIRRYAGDTLKLLWSVSGDSAFLLDESTFMVKNIRATFADYDERNNPLWKSSIEAEEAKVWILKDASYSAEVSGNVLAEAEAESENTERLLLETDEMRIRVFQGKKPSAELKTDSHLRIRIGSTEVTGKGLNAHTTLKRIIINEDIRLKSKTKEGDRVEAKGERLGLKQRGDGSYELRIASNVSVDYTPVDGKSPSISISGSLLRLQLSPKGEILGGEVSGNVILLRDNRPFIYAKQAVHIASMRRITLHGYPTVMFTDGKNELFAKEAVCVMPESREKRLFLQFIDSVVAKLATEHKKKEKRWFLTTTEATITLIREPESLKWQLSTLVCPSRVTIRSIEGKTYIETSSLKVTFSDGIFNDCEGKEFTMRTKGLAAEGESIRITEAGRLVVLSNGVEAELKRREEKLTIDCFNLTIELEGGERLRTLKAEKVERCSIHRKGAKEIRIYPSVLYYRADDGALSFGDDAVRLVFGDDRYTINSLRVNTLKRTAVGKRTEGIMHTKKIKMKMKAGKTHLSFGIDELRKALLQEGVELRGENFSVLCSRLDYDSVLQRAEMRNVKLMTATGDVTLKSDSCTVYLPLNRIVFNKNPKATGKRDGKRWNITAEKILLIYEGEKEAGIDSVTALYAEGDVKASVEEENGVAELMCSEFVYLREDDNVSIKGKPAVLEHRGVIVRERLILYDMKKRVVETGPNIGGYDWEIDPLRLKEKK